MRFIAALIVLAGLSGVLVAVGSLFRPSDIRGEFIERTVGGIEVAYLCQRRGFTEDQCKADFQTYMANAKARR
jgi:hypothetical protein